MFYRIFKRETPPHQELYTLDWDTWSGEKSYKKSCGVMQLTRQNAEMHEELRFDSNPDDPHRIVHRVVYSVRNILDQLPRLSLTYHSDGEIFTPVRASFIGRMVLGEMNAGIDDSPVNVRFVVPITTDMTLVDDLAVMGASDFYTKFISLPRSLMSVGGSDNPVTVESQICIPGGSVTAIYSVIHGDDGLFPLRSIETRYKISVSLAGLPGKLTVSAQAGPQVEIPMYTKLS